MIQVTPASLLETSRNAALPDCQACPIRHRAFCAKCETDELDLLEGTKYFRSFEAGQSVVSSGDQMEFVGSIVSGVATLTQPMEDGRRQLVGLLLPSDFVGRPDRTGAANEVTATTDTVMCCFRKKSFEDLMHTTPPIAQRLLEMTLDELDSAREWMLVLGRKTAREKIASLLSIVARRSIVSGSNSDIDIVSFNLPLTRETMADYLGLTPEAVSRQVSALKNDGIIQLLGKRRIAVTNMTRLIEEAGDNWKLAASQGGAAPVASRDRLLA